jgi:prepilin-type N-terminal cleavage/methylation domain-containing protein
VKSQFKIMMNAKLKGFTLVEMLVVMAIMSVITILSYYLFIALFQKNALSSKFQNQIERIVITEKTLAYHFQKADFAKMMGEEDLFLYSKKDTVHFQLKKDALFFLYSGGMDTLLKGNLEYIKKYEPLLLKQQILNAFSFTFTDTTGISCMRQFNIHNSSKIMMHLDSIYNFR